MVTKIDVYLNKEEDFYSQFRDTKLSKDLFSYILEECYGENVNNDIEITFYSNFKIIKDRQEKMIDALRRCYGLRVQDEEYYLKRTMIRELLLFGGGVLFLLGYYLLTTVKFFSEFILILGWLSIWESVYSFLFDQLEKKMFIKRLKRIARAKINFVQGK